MCPECGSKRNKHVGFFILNSLYECLNCGCNWFWIDTQKGVTGVVKTPRPRKPPIDEEECHQVHKFMDNFFGDDRQLISLVTEYAS